ncbi:MAG: RluA family pseudouridine synthase [Bacillota bacterium]
MQEEIKLEVDENNIRVDKYLADKLKYSRSYIQKLIDKNLILINKQPVEKAAHTLKIGQKIKVIVPEPEPSEIEPQELDFSIIYEDDVMAIINKPSGIPVHPAPSYDGPTLVSGLLYRLNNLSGIGGKKRPGIVHRLDKDTSGLLVVAKNNQAHRSLSRQFKEREVHKVYRAIIKGTPEHSRAKIEAPIGRDPKDRKKMAVVKHNSKQAISIYKVIDKYKGYSQVEVEILTGRTHQIRAHFEFIGHPVIGDDKYGGKVNLSIQISRQMLHAYRLNIIHPVENNRMDFTAELPEDYKKVVDYLEKI